MRDRAISLSRRMGAVLEWVSIPSIPSHKLFRLRRSSGTFGSKGITVSIKGVRELLATVQSVFEEFFPVSRTRIPRPQRQHPIRGRKLYHSGSPSRRVPAVD